MSLLEVGQLQGALREFAAQRDWDQFHTPKNLSMAIAGEAGELVAVTQWMTDVEVRLALATHSEVRQQLSDELADVLIYLVRLADVASIDLEQAVTDKMARNAERYPAHEVRGSSGKR